MLLIVGLDGATWDLLDPWIQRGKLPNLARLCRTGAFGELAATFPPATLPSWTTFMTGVNPGRHGIFDFTRRDFGTYDVRFVNATFRKAPSVWARLSAAQKRVCVIGLPGTYPPEPVNGCMVSGFDTPVTTRADESFVYPRDMAEVVRENGGFPFADFQEFRIDHGWHRRALESLLRGIEVKTRLAKKLLEREPWDCFLLLFGESDTVAHHFWRFHDSLSPRYNSSRGPEFGGAIAEVYEALDASLGCLIDSAPNDADVMVVSDHGFGGVGDKAIYLNRWLQSVGLQKRRESAASGGLAGWTKRQALQLVPSSLQAKAFRLANSRLAGRIESRARFAGIEWEGTRAFSEESNYFPSVWLNLKGREPAGTVDIGDYERVRDEVCAAAVALRDPVRGVPIIKRVWRREELYTGPWTAYAPDLVLELSLDNGYSYSCLPSASTSSGTTARCMTDDEFDGGKLLSMSGSHRRAGVMLMAGPQVRADGRLDGAQMADMAPSILDLCGLGSASEFDGVTLRSVVSRKCSSQSVRLSPHDDELVYKREEEAEIESRLADLGYL